MLKWVFYVLMVFVWGGAVVLDKNAVWGAAIFWLVALGWEATEFVRRHVTVKVAKGRGAQELSREHKRRVEKISLDAFAQLNQLGKEWRGTGAIHLICHMTVALAVLTEDPLDEIVGGVMATMPSEEDIAGARELAKKIRAEHREATKSAYEN